MAVFNPSSAAIDGPVDLELWFDEHTRNLYGEFFNYESKVGFRLYDADDREIAYDYLSYRPFRRRFHRAPRKTPQGQDCIVVSVSCPLKIPAWGLHDDHLPAGVAAHAASRREHGQRGTARWKTRICALRCSPNGSLKLTDKRNGNVYDRLLVFEERADIGDGWFHGVAVNDQVLSSTAAHADVAVVADGVQKATLRITNRLRVPERFEFDRKMARSERCVEMAITSDVTLRPGRRPPRDSHRHGQPGPRPSGACVVRNRGKNRHVPGGRAVRRRRTGHCLAGGQPHLQGTGGGDHAADGMDRGIRRAAGTGRRRAGFARDRGARRAGAYFGADAAARFPPDGLPQRRRTGRTKPGRPRVSLSARAAGRNALPTCGWDAWLSK